MPTTVTPAQRRAAKHQILIDLQEGYSVKEAHQRVSLPLHPVTDAKATWHRLAPFFRLPGRIVWGRDSVQVELRPFNDRRLTRDLAVLCQRVEAAQPRLSDGRALVLSIAAPGCPRVPCTPAPGGLLC